MAFILYKTKTQSNKNKINKINKPAIINIKKKEAIIPEIKIKDNRNLVIFIKLNLIIL